MNAFFEELKRRNVVKASIAYIVIAWVLLQVLSIVLPVVNAPEWVFKTIMLLMLIAFPIWIFLSWVYEVTAEGIIKTAKVDKEKSITAVTNKRLNVLILVGLLLAIIVSFVNRPNADSSPSIAYNTNDFSNSIAVLPFDNMSSDKDNEWFCDGVTEDILTYLSKVKGLRVISRTSTEQYKESDKSVPEIARELGVSYVVEGSVRKQGDRVLITAQLISADDKHLWADNYNEKLNDVFKIQQKVSKKIVKQLKIVLSPEEEKALSSSSTTNVKAYQMFLKGRTIADSRKAEDIEKSIDYYERAIALDSNYADAYAEIANSTFLFIEYDGRPKKEIFEKCRIYIDKALALNKNTVRAYTVLAGILWREGNLEDAKKNLEKAIELNPNDATAHHHFAVFYRNLEIPDYINTLIQINEAYRLDPLSYPINNVRLHTFLQNNLIEEAEEYHQEISYMFTSDHNAFFDGYILSHKNKDLREFIYAYERLIEKEPNNADAYYNLYRCQAGIFNDREKSLAYAKKAHELDLESERYAQEYLYELYYSKRFEEAKSLLDSSLYMEVFSELTKWTLFQDYYVYQNKYEEAKRYLEKLRDLDLNRYYLEKAWLYSKMGDEMTAFDARNSANYVSPTTKSMIFAHLGERDSMYFYIEKASYSLTSAYILNSNTAFDPYRKEERYQAFLKENYFPIPEEEIQ